MAAIDDVSFNERDNEIVENDRNLDVLKRLNNPGAVDRSYCTEHRRRAIRGNQGEGECAKDSHVPDNRRCQRRRVAQMRAMGQRALGNGAAAGGRTEIACFLWS